MQITIANHQVGNNDRKFIVPVHSNGSTIYCSNATWARSSHNHPATFALINRWFAENPAQSDLIFNYYRKFEGLISQNAKREEMIDVVSSIVEMFEWNSFREFCINSGLLFWDNGIKNELEINDHEDGTFFTNEFIDLLVLSTILKAVIPCWGLYYDGFKQELGNNYVLVFMYGLIRSKNWPKFPPVIKIGKVVDFQMQKLVKGSGNSLITGLGKTDLHAFLISGLMIRKVAIYDTASQGRTLIVDIHYHITNKCETYDRVKPDEKVAKGDEDNELSLSDMYEIIQELPPHVPVLLEEYLSKPKQVIANLGYTYKRDVFREILANVNKALPRMGQLSALPIVGLLLGDVLSYKALPICNTVTIGREVHGAVNVAVAITAFVAYEEGWDALGNFLTVETYPQSLDIIDIKMVNDGSIKSLDKDLRKRVEDVYSFSVVSDKNPGIVLIQKTTHLASKMEWKGGIEVVWSLPNDLAKAIIKMGTGVNA